MPHERLQKFLAAAGVASRRHSETLIAEGRVAVNGATVTGPGSKVDPAVDRVTLDGQPVHSHQRKTYLLLNKPPGYVTTAADERGRPTVMDLVPAGIRRVFPVGRLDMESEGLLLLTDDGELAQRMMHPRYGLEREYNAVLAGDPSPDGLDRLRAGAEVTGRQVAPLRVTLEAQAPDSFTARITLGEGRKREVREIARAAGYEVVRLVRVRYGPLNLGALPSGRARALAPREVQRLRRATGLA